MSNGMRCFGSIANGTDMGQVRTMNYRLLPIALLACSTLAGCDNAERESSNSPPQIPRATDKDAFTRRVVTAMCGAPKQRASAIGAIAEPAKGGIDDSDDVYWIANEVAEKGCPRTAR